MSATETQAGMERSTQRGDADGLGSASLAESVGVLLTGVVPAIVRGLFSPRRGAMKALTAIDSDGRAVRLLTSLRRKHDHQGLKLLGGRLVVLWGVEAIKEVLDRSAELYAGDAGAKAKGMSHFQPDAVTLSREARWRDRRAFNESVLATSDRVHPYGARFLAIVADEVERLALGDTLSYSDWERLFDRITLRVIFGDRARDDQRLTGLLEKLMGEANRLVALSDNDAYYELYGALERYLREPDEGSLIARLADAPHTDETRVVQQIPHWMFATRDTLGANTFRALAAILADSDVERQVREEIERADLHDPDAVDGMRYLEGCLHEAMRLWPTTPLLARETMRDVTLAGEELPKGTQLLILNAFNHRDPDHVPDADRLEPGRWANAEHDYRFNHLSNGSQDCPGGPLVLLLGKAVLASLLREYRLTLEHPELRDGAPLPHMLDFYDERFRVART